MYSESDFENFSKKLISSAGQRARKILEEAESAAEKRVKEAREEAAKMGAESEETLKKELVAFEEEQRAKIEGETAREWHRSLSELKSEVLKEIEEEIVNRFEEIAAIFLGWIEREFQGGDLKVYDKVEFKGAKGFNVVKIPDKKIVFSKENLIIEFTPASLVDEYSELIEREIAERMGG